MSRSKRDLLSRVTNKIVKSKRVQNNTLEIDYADGSRAVRLHDTDIITILEDGKVILNSGGWKTVTTKDRLNSPLNPYWPAFQIVQKNRVWYLYKMGPDGSWTGAAPVCRFEDGLTISGSGKVQGGSPITDGKADRKFKAKIKKYADLCVSKMPLPKPGNGDCWFCLMETQGGKTLGDATKNTEHLLSHMDEGYVVPSLVANALKEAGAAQGYYWTAFQEPKVDIGLCAIPRMIYRYIIRRFGYAA